MHWEHALELMAMTGCAWVLPPSGGARVYEQLLRDNKFEDLERGVYVFDTGDGGGARIVSLAEFRADVERAFGVTEYPPPTVPRTLLKWQFVYPAVIKA